MKIFLGFSFRNEDKDIVEQAGQLITSHLVDVETGERLAGEQLTPAVQQRIMNSDALVAILARRDSKQDGKWTTHQWVFDEMGYARANNKNAIALVEEGIEIGGLYHSLNSFP